MNGDGRTSVRASYALAYEYTPLTFHIDTTGFAAPFGNEVDQPSVSLDNPYSTYPGGNPFPYVKPTYPFKHVNVFFPQFSSFTSIPFDTKNMYAQSWNFSLQRELPGSIVASATYTGLQMTHVWTLQALSPAIYIPGNCVAGQFGLTGRARARRQPTRTSAAGCTSRIRPKASTWHRWTNWMTAVLRATTA